MGALYQLTEPGSRGGSEVARAMMDAERDRVHWDPGNSAIEITTGHRNIAIGGLSDAVSFESETDDGETSRALWLTPNQALVLMRMVRYIIERVKIRPESKATLEDLLPTLEHIWPGQAE